MLSGPRPSGTRRLLATVVTVASLVVLLLSNAASAHSLDSSTLWVQVGDESVELTISFALETYDEALGTDTLDQTDIEGYAGEVVAYVEDHLTVTADDGTVWAETVTGYSREPVEGIESFTVELTLDTAGSDLDDFTISYDAIIELVSGHQAVVVLTDAAGEISSPGVLTSDSASLTIGEGTATVNAADMIRLGFDHVLEGADHLLFLTTLLLPAPLVVAAGRWRRGPGAAATLRKVVHVVTAFTVGHSLTLIASSLGWVSVPARPVEIAIALSVAVSAIHAIRPLAKHGEELIAVGFGLVHGLAFAGILADLGLDGSTSLLTLLAFNLGVELSQLLSTALLFPSLFVLSQTRFYPRVRVGGAGMALAAALGWAADRIGLFTNPFAGVEDLAIEHPWWIVGGLAALAGAAWLTDGRDQPTEMRLTDRFSVQ